MDFLKKCIDLSSLCEQVRELVLDITKRVE